jgi:hypothetical protein
MCLIINFKPEQPISAELMEVFAKRNNDGFGIMWIQDNRLCHIKYGPDKMEMLWPTYENLKAYEGFIHLRMRTHGDTNQEMAHPFNCGYGIYMMHNGILDVTGEDKSKSDTWHFVKRIVQPLFEQSRNPHKLFRSQAFADLLHKYMGTNNRIVIGDRGGFMLFNPNAWYTIKNENTKAVGLLVSNQYAWSETAFDPKKETNYNYNSQYYGHSRSLLEDESDDDEYFGVAMGSSRKRMGKHLTYNQTNSWLGKHFFNLGKDWWGDRFCHIYKARVLGGIDRRADLDESEQFWNQFDSEVLQDYADWITEKEDADNYPLTKKAIEDIKKRQEEKFPKKSKEVVKPEPSASQLILNWANKSPEQIKKDMENFPEKAAEAVVALTHEPVKQAH